jgi:hypothetical protein
LIALESLRQSGGAKEAAAFDRSVWARHFTFDHVFDSMHDPAASASSSSLAALPPNNSSNDRFDDQNAVFQVVMVCRGGVSGISFSVFFFSCTLTTATLTT